MRRLLLVIAFSLLQLQIAHATKRVVVLVADLSPSKISAEDAATISDILRGELAEERKFVIVQRSEMDTIAKEMEFQMSGCTDQACAVQMGEMLNAEKVIVGRVAKLFGKITMVAQVVDMAKNDIEFSEKVSCPEDFDAIQEAISTLAKNLSAHVPLLAEMKKGSEEGVWLIKAGKREGLKKGMIVPFARISVVRDFEGKATHEKSTKMGKLKLTYVSEKNSEAKVVEGEAQNGDLAVLDEMKAAPPEGEAEASATPAARNTNGRPDKARATAKARPKAPSKLKNGVHPAPSGSCVGRCHSEMGRAAYVHGPVGAGQCEICHEWQGKGFKTAMGGEPELCYACHERQDGDNYLHAPAEDACTACHDPHQSNAELQLKADSTQGLCFSCHDADMINKAFMHGPVAAGDCNICHQPHSAPYKALITERGNELCMLCHVGRDFSNHSDKPDWACTRCHSPHGTDNNYMLYD